MKIEVYSNDKEKVLRLKLVYEHNQVYLVAVSKNGDVQRRGYILHITDGGELSLSSYISEDLGLSLDEYGSINMV